MKARVVILYGYGINCQDETEYACRTAGFGDVRKVHLNKFLNGEEKLGNEQFLIFPGGFSGGDQLGAGVFFALKMEKLREALQRFVGEEKLILGICNGFQVLVNLGLLPGYLTYNDCGNFQNRWVSLSVNGKSPCIFTKGIESMELPIRHGEGKFWAVKDTLDGLEKNQQIVAKYVREDGSLAEGIFPFNPNGSLKDIAGISDSSGRVLGLMPHPEAHIDWTNHPRWTRKKEILRRAGKPIPKEGQGLSIFKNAFEYLKEF